MIYQNIQGERVPALGLGTWQIEGDDCCEAVEHGPSLGYRHVDTAQAYENEDQVGKGLANSSVSRDDVFLTTKVWIENLAPEDVRSSTEDSLRRLGTDYVDLLLLHWPPPEGEIDPEESLDALRALQEDGKARHIGVSNYPSDLLKRSLDYAKMFCDQVEYHPFLSQREVLEVARNNDLLVTAYSPLARGEVSDNDTLQEIGEAHGKSATQVSLRWLVQQDHVAAIPKASSADHREDNLDVFDFELSDDEMQRLHGLARGERIIDPDFAPDWD